MHLQCQCPHFLQVCSLIVEYHNVSYRGDILRYIGSQINGLIALMAVA